jgi:hypothetical protein
VILAACQVGDAWRATPTRRRIVGWVARGQAGPPPPPVVEVAASVTPCRHDAGAAVLDEHGQRRAGGSAAGRGGDVGGSDHIPVALQSTAVAAEPATRGLGDPQAAGRAGGGGAALVHQPHHDAGHLGLVPQRLHQGGAAPLPQPPVLHPARIPVSDPRRVAHQQPAHPLLAREGDDLLGGLMVGLVDAAAMARFGTPQASPMAPPTARPALPRRGCPPGGPGLAGLLIGTMQVAFRPDRPPDTSSPRSRPPRRRGG